MVGKGVLLECLASAEVGSVLVLNRQTCGITHPKLQEVVSKNIPDLSAIKDFLLSCNACFFCLGVSAVGLSEQAYADITFNLTTTVAKSILASNPNLTFCYVSGAGTDSSEKGRMMWARVKGKTENALLAMPFKAAYMFRPGFIQPMKNIQSKTNWYQILYTVFTPFYYILKPFKSLVTDTTSFGKAMILVAIKGYQKHILSNADINALAES